MRTDRCPVHVEVAPGTLAWFEYARRQERRGAKQTRCADCGLWFWPAELGRRPRRGEERA